MYFNRKGIANILSLAHVSDRFRVTMDTKNSPTIDVHLDDGSVLSFARYSSGIYFYNTEDSKNKKRKVYDYSLLNTVIDNNRSFTKKQISDADDARLLQEKCGWPSSNDLKSYIRNGQIMNCPYVEDAVDVGNEIYGEPVPILKGKMTQRTHHHVRNMPRVSNTSTILMKNPVDELDIDYFHVNGRVFLHTKSKNIKMLTTHRCHSTGRSECVKIIRSVTRMYSNRGFIIVTYNGDNAFKHLNETLGEANLNIVARNDHVGAIE